MEIIGLILCLLLANGLADKDLFGGRADARYRILKDLHFTETHFGSRSRPTLYLLSTFPLYNPDAKAACEDEGAELMEISTEAQFTFITDWLGAISGYDGQQVHIAGQRVKNKFVFAPNRPVPYLEWHKKEPSRTTDDNIDEDCLVLERRRGQYKMNDVRCVGLTRRFLCAKQIRP